MKKYLILPLLLLALSGCAGTINTPTGPPSPVASAQDAAEKSLYAIGAALQATPGILNALYDAGKIGKTDFNNAASIYNQALGSYKMAVNALKAAVDAGTDPNTSTAYLTAFNAFMGDKKLIDNLLLAFGEKPIGTGVNQ